MQYIYIYNHSPLSLPLLISSYYHYYYYYMRTYQTGSWSGHGHDLITTWMWQHLGEGPCHPCPNLSINLGWLGQNHDPFTLGFLTSPNKIRMPNDRDFFKPNETATFSATDNTHFPPKHSILGSASASAACQVALCETMPTWTVPNMGVPQIIGFTMKPEK